MGLLGTMMIPYSVVMIPQYIGFSRLDWVDTLPPLIIPGLFGNIVVICFIRQYLQSAMPTELIEAAKIDGAAFRAFLQDRADHEARARRPRPSALWASGTIFSVR